MQKVQEALAATGIPAFAGAWRPTTANPAPPEQYLVYTTMITEDEHWDDALICLRVYAYINLWSRTDPTAAAALVRSAMHAADFFMVEETDDASGEAGYDGDTRSYCVSWTWVLEMEVNQWR